MDEMNNDQTQVPAAEPAMDAPAMPEAAPAMEEAPVEVAPTEEAAA